LVSLAIELSVILWLRRGEIRRRNGQKIPKGKLEDVIKEWLIIQWPKIPKGKLEDVIEEWLIIQWSKDTKGEIRRRSSNFPLVSFGHWVINHSLITSSNFHFGIFWPLYCQSFFKNDWYFNGHKIPKGKLEDVIEEWLIIQCPKDTKGEIRWRNKRMTDNTMVLRLRLLISPLLSFGHCIISHSLIRSSNFPFGIFWPLYCQSFFDYVF
jgi:hypothetical protein